MENSPNWELLTKVPNDYAMATAVRLITTLEQGGCIAKDQSYKTKWYGSLVEKGVDVACDNLVFTLMCSYDDIFIKRVSGNKARYWQVCDDLRELSSVCG